MIRRKSSGLSAGPELRERLCAEASEARLSGDNRWIARMIFVFGAALACAGYAPAAATKEVAPFLYRFQVTSVTLTSTFTKGNATATTQLRLGVLPKRTSMTWYGRRGPAAGLSWNGVGQVVVRMAGTATYSGLEQPSCNGTVTLDTSRWRSIYAGVSLTQSWDAPRAKLSASAGRFPIATIYPRRGGVCENGVLTWWQPGAVGVRPFGDVRKPGFSISTSHRETFDDDSALEWTARMTVRKIRYRAIDCRHTQWC
jgi:hypothetical protein